MNLVQTHKCSFSIMGSDIFFNRVVVTKFIEGCRMVWDLIWGISCFFKSKTEEAKRGGEPPILLLHLTGCFLLDNFARKKIKKAWFIVKSWSFNIVQWTCKSIIKSHIFGNVFSDYFMTSDCFTNISKLQIYEIECCYLYKNE